MTQTESNARWRATDRGKEVDALAHKRAVERHRQRITEAKAGGCVDCGLPESGEKSTCLHFHHVEPSTKRYNVACMSGMSDEKFFAEVAKCVLLCNPCHGRRHSGEMRHPSRKLKPSSRKPTPPQP